MHEYLMAFIIGVVEGLTEFIPVSSTGHMIIVGDLIGFTGEKASVFEVFIQLGAILSVVLVYKDKIFRMFRRENWFRQEGLSLTHIAVGMIPVMGVGYILHKPIKAYLFSTETVVIGLVAGSLLMLFAEKFHKPIDCEDVDTLTVKQAFKVGLFQILALWPGFSRSGSTITGGLILGVSRKAAADFSFIMAVPIMSIACVYDLLKIYHMLTAADLAMFAIGFVTAFAVAYVSIIWFLGFLNKSSLSSFAYYRLVVALVTWCYFM